MMPRLVSGELPALCHSLTYDDRWEVAVFGVTVRDHMMVAHSFRGEVFGPAQAPARRDVRRGRDLPRREPRRRRHPGRHRPRRRGARGGRRRPGYRNLDDEPVFAGTNTTTEVLAQHVADRLAEQVGAGALGGRARRRASSSPCTSPTSRGRATSGAL